MPATQRKCIYGGLTLDVDRHYIGSATATTHQEKRHNNTWVEWLFRGCDLSQVMIFALLAIDAKVWYELHRIRSFRLFVYLEINREFLTKTWHLHCQHPKLHSPEARVECWWNHRVLVLKEEEEEEVSLRVEHFSKKVRINRKSHSNILPAIYSFIRSRERGQNIGVGFAIDTDFFENFSTRRETSSSSSSFSTKTLWMKCI